MIKKLTTALTALLICAVLSACAPQTSPAAAIANSTARAHRGGSTDQSIASDPQKKAAAAKHSHASDSTQIQPRVCLRSVASDSFKTATSAAAAGRSGAVDAGGSMTSDTGGPWGY